MEISYRHASIQLDSSLEGDKENITSLFRFNVWVADITEYSLKRKRKSESPTAIDTRECKSNLSIKTNVFVSDIIN